MKEERTITEFGRVPMQRVWWSAIFAGTFFGLGIMVILSFFGLAIGAAIAGPRGATQGVTAWAGIWSLVTAFVGFLAGGWLAARLSGSQARPDGRLHGLVVWGLGSVAILYFAMTTTTRVAGILTALSTNLGMSAAPGTAVAPGTVEGITVTAATWALFVAICGLFGGIIGGHAGGYTEAASVTRIRRVA
jgi:hypothetical protein